MFDQFEPLLEQKYILINLGTEYRLTTTQAMFFIKIETKTEGG